VYLDEDGARIDDEQVLERLKALAIPPAWRRVRISAAPGARLQATGVDAAGRRQYLYHPSWRERQDARKFARSLELARRLPAVRRTVTQDLRGDRGPRRQALAAAIRLVDRAGLRVGSRRYARENGSFGATTLTRAHVTVDGDRVTLDFPGKSGMQWSVELVDADLARFLAPRAGRRSRRAALGYDEGRGFQPLGAAGVNGYLRQIAGLGVSAKDLRTWRGTAIAGASLAWSREAGLDAETAWRKAVADAAEWLNNTPTVARGSYLDPRLLLAYEEGRTAKGPSDAAVADLLEGLAG
jgi:DNA topoisomerase-1